MLAAGLSSRMGRWKMQLPWGDGTVLDGALDHALAFCDRVVLVTGFRGEALRQRYAGQPNITLCHNPNYERGMFSSLQRGIRLLADGHFFVIPGDMPAVSPGVYAALWQQRGSRCLIPTIDGGCGHPVLLPPAMREQIRNANPQANLRQLIVGYGRETVDVTCASIHWDLDTPQQYAALRQRLLYQAWQFAHREDGEYPE
ncbi:NTP transferase domain-containing protein [Enterobacteriaceae bacterium YMB-R22]|uniref:NTP transferase domain-containing protein n=3 Tax=Enterobacteriaceae TaxID=543 RepID=A0A8K0V5Z6_9ENTR|nr:NTP transferase domain-containing protein [Tenebrionibacter intestinalis]MBV4414061.1 NTP transferase domain-containing protein [Tenebrionicola larvae]MBV5095619.1 NTP transferase domain-containing protein [Tenebrionicola larvae]